MIDASKISILNKYRARLRISGRLNLSYDDASELITALEKMTDYARALENNGVALGTVRRLRETHGIDAITGETR